MYLKDLIRPLTIYRATGDLNIEITGIEVDSRQVKPGDLFIALRGFTVDGHEYIAQAVEKGAAAVLVEQSISNLSIPVIEVKDTRKALAIVSTKFYRYPTKEMKLIGVTGTNGKTTTTYLIEQLLTDAGHKTGVIGTIQMKVGEKTFPVKNTTPDILDLQKSFRMMRDEGCEYSVIEVSSHALSLGRTWGSQFRIGVFTNLSQDHLDFHETMEKYKEAKGLLFSQLANQYGDEPEDHAYAVLNADDEASKYYAQITPAQVITYGIDQAADVQAKYIQISPEGMEFELHTFRGIRQVKTKLIGKFNVYNLLAAISTALIEGISLDQIVESITKISGVNGRFEPVHAGQDFTVIVDYAHTPDSLENVLRTIREFAGKRVTCVVGCGGDRDRSKRPLMAQIATRYSDWSVFTSDNPRTEDPEAILRDMVAGVKDENLNEYTVIPDRREAIYVAIEKAKPGDIVLIAGKGHETYQEIHGVRYDFDDRLVAREAILKRQQSEAKSK